MVPPTRAGDGFGGMLNQGRFVPMPRVGGIPQNHITSSGLAALVAIACEAIETAIASAADKLAVRASARRTFSSRHVPSGHSWMNRGL
jgi:hypothetical protein